MKIGILTYHSSHNFGAFLQAYALCGVLRERTGHAVEIIDFSMAKAAKMNMKCIFSNKKDPITIPYGMVQYRTFERSSQKYHTLSEDKLVTDDLNRFAEWVNGKYDIIVVGSDEIWKLDGYRGFPTPYWLPGVTGCKKMAYAASSRTEPQNISEQTRDIMTACLESFSYIGVRDQPTKALIESALPKDRSCYFNCDPTFVYDFDLDPERGRALIQSKFGVSGDKKCVALMIGDPHLAYSIINTYSDRYDFISLYRYYRGTKGFFVPDPFEWANLIAGADGLITTFFHGTVFAIKTDTPFLSFESRNLSDAKFSKIYDLLKRNKLEDHFSLLQDTSEHTLAAINEFFEKLSSGNSEKFASVCTREKTNFNSFLEQVI